MNISAQAGTNIMQYVYRYTQWYTVYIILVIIWSMTASVNVMNAAEEYVASAHAQRGEST